MYEDNFTINTTQTYIDLGLTFHSYKFCNMNEDYYMVSFLKTGGQRWWERGVCPYETIEYLIPSGDYQLRLYNASYDELTNFSVTVNNSKLYMINGTNLSLIIDGQSIITGQLLELGQSLDVATMPDLVTVVANIPIVYSTFERDGAIIGNTILVCPAKILTGETTNSTTINETSVLFNELVPDDSVTENGTVTIKEDTLYFAGNASVTCVNVTYNGTTTSYGYIPNHIDLLGGNVTVECTGNLSVTRKTRFQQVWKFYWTKYTDTNYYEATLDIDNNLHVPINETYIYIEFANDTTPDYTTVGAYDVTNGVYLTRGTNYDATASGAHFYVNSIAGSGTRTFTLDYYGVDDPVVPTDAITVVYDYGWETLTASISGDNNDKSYFYIDANWFNDDDAAFVGEMDIQFNFDTEGKIIASSSWIIYDNENDRYLDREEFAFSGGGIKISQETMGTVSPNGARSFKAWFLFTEASVAATVQTPFLEVDVGGGLLVIHVFVVSLAIIAVAGALLGYQKRNKGYLWLSLTFVLLLFLLFMSQRHILF